MVRINTLFESRIDAYIRLMGDSVFMQSIMNAGRLLSAAVRSGKAILICGNGGSAAEAMHMSGEIVGRFKTDRNALPSISLTADTASLTAVANDFGYQEVFARQVEAYHCFAGAVVLLSTSGNSENLLAAAKKAKEYGLETISLLGRDGGELKDLCDAALIVPSFDTAVIQEIQLALIHMLCEMIEVDCH